MARIIAGRLGPLLGQQILVDNRAGANGAIACEYVAGAEPDGHTLLFGYIGTHAMNPALQKVGYDPVGDFEPVGLVGSSPTLMVAHPRKGPADVPTLVAHLRETSERYGYASAGDGTPPHFAAELFQLSTRTSLSNATHDGAAPAIADTIDGRSQVMFPSLFTAHPFLRSGKLRALAVAGPARLAVLPSVPTLKEVGVHGAEVTQWYGLFAPAGTAAEVVDRLNRALNEVLRDPAIIDRFQSHGAWVEPGSPTALKERVGSELARWRDVVAKSRLTPQQAEPLTVD
jgi:tripartite-type tricarboxylate transporter receptor subunit TctC